MDAAAVARQGLRGEPAFVTTARLVTNAERQRAELRVLATDGTRLFLLAAKPPHKPEAAFHSLDLASLAVDDAGVLTIDMTTARLQFLEVGDLEGLVLTLTSMLREGFPSTPMRMLFHGNLHPPVDEAAAQREPGPCDDFLEAYKFARTYHNITTEDCNVAAIIRRYAEQGNHEMLADDFGNFCTPEAPALVTALHYNTWFTSLTLSSVRPAPEVLDSLALLVERTACLRELRLSRLQGDTKQWMRLATALGRNPHQSIRCLDLSHCALGDVGATALAESVEMLVMGMQELRVADVGMSTKAAVALGKALATNKRNGTSLRILDASDNAMGTDGVSAFLSVLAESNVVSTLRFANTACFVEPIFISLSAAVCQHLAELNLGGNKFSSKKTLHVTPQMTQFLLTTPSLVALDLSGTKLPSQATRAILDSLANNPLLSQVALYLARCDLGSVEENAKFLHLALPRLACVSVLDIGDNDFTDDQLANIISAVASNARTMATLKLDGSLSKSKTVQRTMLSLKSLFYNSLSGLSTLSLRDMRLKTDMLSIIPMLDSSESITHVDLTGNNMGDAGARSLASLLNHNNRLRSIELDDNGITAAGLRELAAALDINTSVQRFPLPLQDIVLAQSKAPEDTAAAVHALQQALCKNYAPSRHIGARQRKGGAQTVVSMQVLDTLVEQLNSTAARAGEDPATVDRALRRVQECTNVSKSLARLEAELVLAQQDTISRRLHSFAEGLTDMLGETLRSSIKDLVQTVEVETGLSPDMLWQPQMGDYHTMCRELIDQVILTSAQRSIASGAAEQVFTASALAVSHVVDITAEHLQAVLIARSSKGDVVPELPSAMSAKPAEAHQSSILSNMKELTLTRPVDPDDVLFEAPVSFDDNPAEAGAASAQPTLVHHTKGRPRNTGRRPPSRERNRRLSDDVSGSEVKPAAKPAPPGKPAPPAKVPPAKSLQAPDTDKPEDKSKQNRPVSSASTPPGDGRDRTYTNESTVSAASGKSAVSTKSMPATPGSTKPGAKPAAGGKKNRFGRLGRLMGGKSKSLGTALDDNLGATAAEEEDHDAAAAEGLGGLEEEAEEEGTTPDAEEHAEADDGRAGKKAEGVAASDDTTEDGDQADAATASRRKSVALDAPVDESTADASPEAETSPRVPPPAARAALLPKFPGSVALPMMVPSADVLKKQKLLSRAVSAPPKPEEKNEARDAMAALRPTVSARPPPPSSRPKPPSRPAPASRPPPMAKLPPPPPAAKLPPTPAKRRPSAGAADRPSAGTADRPVLSRATPVVDVDSGLLEPETKDTAPQVAPEAEDDTGPDIETEAAASTAAADAEPESEAVLEPESVLDAEQTADAAPERVAEPSADEDKAVLEGETELAAESGVESEEAAEPVEEAATSPEPAAGSAPVADETSLEKEAEPSAEADEPETLAGTEPAADTAATLEHAAEPDADTLEEAAPEPEEESAAAVETVTAAEPEPVAEAAQTAPAEPTPEHDADEAITEEAAVHEAEEPVTAVEPEAAPEPEDEAEPKTEAPPPSLPQALPAPPLRPASDSESEEDDAAWDEEAPASDDDMPPPPPAEEVAVQPAATPAAAPPPVQAAVQAPMPTLPSTLPPPPVPPPATPATPVTPVAAPLAPAARVPSAGKRPPPPPLRTSSIMEPDAVSDLPPPPVGVVAGGLPAPAAKPDVGLRRQETLATPAAKPASSLQRQETFPPLPAAKPKPTAPRPPASKPKPSAPPPPPASKPKPKAVPPPAPATKPRPPAAE